MYTCLLGESVSRALSMHPVPGCLARVAFTLNTSPFALAMQHFTRYELGRAESQVRNMAVTMVGTGMVNAIGAERSTNPNPSKPDQHRADSALTRGQSTPADYRQYRSLPCYALFEVARYRLVLLDRCYQPLLPRIRNGQVQLQPRIRRCTLH
jgi:hypothetical protein